MRRSIGSMLAPLFMGLLLPPSSFGEDRNVAGIAPAGALDESRERFLERFEIGGVIEFGGGYKSKRLQDERRESQSGIHLTTAEFGIAAAIHDWIRAETVFLYEDPFDAEEGSVTLDAGLITFGNTDKFPLYVSVGKLYVPFGVLRTHLPDDAAASQPMTLLLGETSENAVVVGIENSGFSLSGYVFNGNLKSAGNTTGTSFGFDGRFRSSEGSPVDLLLGASYTSNLADSNGLTDAIAGNFNVLKKYIGGLDAYLHIGFRGLFLDVEHMTALDKFHPSELPRANGGGAQPSVWNIEAGYNWNWGRNLEMVFNYARSRETAALGFARNRFGLGLNQDISHNVTASFAFLRDRYHSGDINGRDKSFTVLGQIAVKF